MFQFPAIRPGWRDRSAHGLRSGKKSRMAFDPVVVSAADGPLPPTVDQLKALKAQGATSVDFQLINTDIVDDAELLELVELELRNLAEENGLAVGSITRGTSGSSGSSGLYGPPS